MPKHVYDNAKKEIEVGDYVAYNHSGNVAAGYITSIAKYSGMLTIRRIVPEPEVLTEDSYYIRSSYHKDKYHVGQVMNEFSKVKNPNSVLILQKGNE